MIGRFIRAVAIGIQSPVSGRGASAGGVRHFVAVGVQVRGETVVQRARVLELAGLGTGDELWVVVQVEEVTTVGKRRRRDADVLLRILPGCSWRNQPWVYSLSSMISLWWASTSSFYQILGFGGGVGVEPVVSNDRVHFGRSAQTATAMCSSTWCDRSKLW